MRKEITVLEENIKTYMFQFLLPLKTGGKADRECFRLLEVAMERLMVLHRSEPFARKSFLATLFGFPHGVISEIPYSDEKEYLEVVARKMEIFLGLLLGQEVPEDRQPGVPRII